MHLAGRWMGCEEGCEVRNPSTEVEGRDRQQTHNAVVVKDLRVTLQAWLDCESEVGINAATAGVYTGGGEDGMPA